MIADLGRFAVFISALLAIYAAITAFLGARRGNQAWVDSARNALIAIFPLMLLSGLTMVYSLLNNDFSLEYVWRVTSRETPTYLKITALWGGQAGSLLFWNILLAAFTAFSMRRDWSKYRHFMPYVIMVTAFTQMFFLALTVGIENPFARLAFVPAEGNGLNPLLRHPGMIIHPPMLYLGFVGFTIPYAFAMAALISGELDDTWFRITRRWTLIAWLFLSMGLILGGRWAYDVLGWGGYWAWDPVENASFMPWLAGTAFLHSVMIQEKQKMFKGWTISLIVVTYILMIYGTFIVRTGIISSVHSFAQSTIGNYFFAFIVVMILFSFFMVYIRRDKLASENKLQSFFSRESAFLLNNFLILGICFATFWGTNYPIISELLFGEQVTVGEIFYEKVNGPMFAVLLLLMGVAPLTMWTRTSLQRLELQLRYPALAATVIIILIAIFGTTHWVALLGFWIVSFSLILTVLEFIKGTRARMKPRGSRPGEPIHTAFFNLMARNRRRYGGYWIHIGVLLMGIGVIGSELFQDQRQIFLTSGQQASLGEYTVVFNGTQAFEAPDDLIIIEADVTVLKNGEVVKTLNPRNEVYQRTGQTMTIADERSTLLEDFYVRMIDWEGITATAATLRLYLNPLINWVWIGGFVFVIGTMIAVWPDPAEERLVAVAEANRPVLAPGD
ncbi:MAG: heme lyase CcmF/NrfE family subunit [Anaerolineales bacterium]|nr:heme lyase CcmF/NrfE family subunit [Anaerolineales bacterium]MCB0016318.1 heme lyase CcmF/NrfE family subunit [Anaerolineales bacterium]MCB0029289.1 heme lyase CcmF/NrfE family subunit [Anaerolineales bacterium]MCB8958780.1 heme lyase CcmF/NrfE family subunit [Ardenticatenales bacterium]